MEARNAAAAGDAAAEEALEAAWGEVEGRFEETGARAWSTVLLQVVRVWFGGWAARVTNTSQHNQHHVNCANTQVFKVFVLARITPTALRALPGMETATLNAAALAARTAAAAAAQAATAAAQQQQQQPNAAPGPSRVVSAVSVAATASRAKSPAAAGSRGFNATAVAAAAAAEELPLVELGPADIPLDEVLSGSNVFSTAEACLLCWLNVNTARVFPERVRCCGGCGAGCVIRAAALSFVPSLLALRCCLDCANITT